MQEGGEALYLRVAPTVICAFAYVIYSDIDVLTETPYGILVFCVVVVIIEMMLLAVFCVVEVVMMLLRVLVWLRDTFLELSREMSRKIVKNSGNIVRMLDPCAYCSRCHCHIIREKTSGFMIQRLKHDVVKRIRDGVYHVNVESIGDVVYNVVPRDNSISRESYNLAAACSNEFVLKSLYYFYPNCNQVCHVMEYYQQSLEHWLQENSLFDHQVKNLNPEFLQIIRDVLRGIDYLHSVKKRCHRNLSTLNIVIVNGRAKITGMVNDAATSKTKHDDHLDYKHLANVIRTCFGSKQQNIPTELKLFLTYISNSKSSRLLNFENHPIFLSPLQRLCYRVTAYTFLYFGKSKNSFELTLNNKLQKCKWKDKVDKFQVVLDCREKKQRRKFLYDQSAISFMRFARNVIVHLDDNFSQDLVSKKLTAEEVEEELNTCMPEFMPILHEVLVDHGHLMIVLDAVLK
ncbi:hypothetical protein I3843_11G086000 [Carya illinoinensis]|uniref:Serine-threonine/tyrosine-protein kinase catalytic domain-containing protein n=1 Tax=Carya illinoinensis TaxID=32201 RepID=A0A922DNF6_CARIL|nr:hypothetical protein I3760_11G085400 [Carya illinoinensis]KAG6687704.1 hypothetical protein I3842_11G086700 [Carya illinoinensis]KAG7955700.1 hypothetical protein I3843_11G086000 [Carya illinoinensis]